MIREAGWAGQPPRVFGAPLGPAGRAYAGLLERLLLPIGDRALGQPMMRHLAFVEQVQWWSRERILDYQAQRLRELVSIAYAEVPFYRDYFDRAGVRPTDIRTPADLAKLPAVTKGALRAHYPRQTSRETGYRTHEASSSGSTGERFSVLADVESVGITRALSTVGFRWSGWLLGQPHVQYGGKLDRGVVKSLKDTVFRTHYANSNDLSDATLDATLDVMAKRNIRHAFGYAGALFLLARRATERGLGLTLDGVVSWGDNLYDHYRRAIEGAFSTRVFNQYGCAEGILVASQCGEHPGFHIFSTDVIVETVDGDDIPVPAGKPGRILLTRLHPGPMPLIRYEVGDIGTLGVDDHCRCGRGLEILSSLEGRDTDFILTTDGGRLNVHFFTLIFEQIPEIEQFQVVQDDLASIQVRVVPGVGYSHQTEEFLRRCMLERGSGALRIDFIPVDDIPAPPTSKRRFVVSNVAKGAFGSG